MSKVQLTGAFARFRGKLNKSEVLVLKGCPCGKAKALWVKKLYTEANVNGRGMRMMN